MSEYTKGPWVAVPMAGLRWHGGSKPIFEDGLWWILPASNTERNPIGEVDHADDYHPPTRSQAEFDAKLMAAAPELLEALKAMVADDAFAELCQSIGEEPAWLNMARAAISKAEAPHA